MYRLKYSTFWNFTKIPCINIKRDLNYWKNGGTNDQEDFINTHDM